MITLAAIFGLFLIGLWIASRIEEQPNVIAKVYTQRGRWFYLKYCLITCMLFLVRMKYYVYGKRRYHKDEDMDKLHELSNHDQAFDAVFFQAVSQNGIYICTGTERRHGGKLNGLVYIVHPEYGVLESLKLPKTELNADVVSLLNKKSYSGEGISFTPIVPMKKWKMSYNGLMRIQNDPTKLVQVKLEADWTSNYDWFFVEIDVPISTIARCMAVEVWTRQFFQNLKEAHQSHYEQMGYVNGTLQIDGKLTSLVDIDAFRDHSFGHKRDWSLMHRYIYCMFYLSDRTKISLGVISHHGLMTHLELGFVSHPDGRIDPIESIDLRLYEHAENGVLPEEFEFTFESAGKSYDVKMKFAYEAKHYKGSNDEAVMNERFHVCEVNGITGKGISEWHYNKNMFKTEAVD
ncbi:unnamed protein product [Phyllotreta striolata]|uniref:DUF7064 domain-containing protein n=1 Tax=Phyllotreta striolata TaxID=444603 RepID=A0A9N9THV9_PHYSR|nr:unnamed protein product [Phyllotreta striolata]